MSSFTTPLIVQLMADRKWKIEEEFVYYIGEIDSGKEIRVPKGFITDLASVPRIFWIIFPPNGKSGKASVIHDYMYVNAIGTKEYADKTFIEAMKVLGVGKFKRHLMYYAVKYFGRGSY